MRGDINMEREERVFRGEIWIADLGTDNKKGSEQQGKRPVLVISNDLGNANSSCVTVASITGSTSKTELDSHQKIQLKSPSTILFEQVITISKERLEFKLGRLSTSELLEANYRIAMAMGLIGC